MQYYRMKVVQLKNT